MDAAKYSATRERSVGLGAMGFHSCLQNNGIPFESALARAANLRMFKHLRREADAASRVLAEERGACPDAAERGVPERFSHKLAIAPTASIRVICGGTSACIEPIPANIYTHKTLSGSFSVRNPALQKVLAAKGLDTEDTWQSILAHEGSVQHLECLSDDEKAVFRTAFEIDQRWVVELAGDRAPLHLPGPVAEPLSAQRHPQVGSADAALDGMGARREVAVLLPLEERAARGLRRRRSRQHARLAARSRSTAERRQIRRVPRHVSNRQARDQIELINAPGLLTPSRAATSRSAIRGPSTTGAASSRSTGCRRRFRSARTARTGTTRITDAERNLLTQVFRFFTQSDVEVQDNYMERYARVFRPTEIKMMLAAFANMETVHIAAYALLLETLGMPDSEFTAFMDYSAMRDKHDYLQAFGVETDADIAAHARDVRRLHRRAAALRELRDPAELPAAQQDARHGAGGVAGACATRRCTAKASSACSTRSRSETGALTQAVRDDIVDCARTVVKLEDRFVDLAFEMGPIEGLSARRDQGLHPLHRRLAPEAARPAAALRREGTSAALAHRAC